MCWSRPSKVKVVKRPRVQMSRPMRTNDRFSSDMDIWSNYRIYLASVMNGMPIVLSSRKIQSNTDGYSAISSYTLLQR